MQIAAGAIFTDDDGRFMIVIPTYQEWWNVPGGAAEDGESPWEACAREVEEELGLRVQEGRLLAVDFRYPNEKRPPRLRFLFDCGSLGADRISKIRLREDELSEYRFVHLSEVSGRFQPVMERRLRHALPLVGTGRVAYLEEGEPLNAGGSTTPLPRRA